MPTTLRPTAAIVASLLLGPFAQAQTPEPSATVSPPVEPSRAVLPDVTDPLLDAALPAKKLLRSFRQAKALIDEKSSELVQAKVDVERSRGVWRQALAGVLPSLTGFASITGKPVQPSFIPGTTLPDYSYLMQLVASERVVAPATWQLIGAVDLDIDRAKLSADDLRRRVYGAVAEAVLAVVVADKAADLGRAGLRAALQTYALWQKRKEFGASTELDLARLARDVASARLLLIERNEALRGSEEALGLALGSSEPWGVAAEVDAAGVEQELRRVCEPIPGPSARADVAAAATSLAVSEKLAKTAELDFLPTVDIVTTLGMQPAITSTAPHANFTVAGVLSWSIWDGGHRYGSLRVARANVTSATAKLDDLSRKVEVETRSASRRITVAVESLAAATTVRDLARETDRLVRVALAAGAGSTLDLVQAQEGLRRSEIEVALRQFDLLRAKLERFLVSARCRR